MFLAAVQHSHRETGRGWIWVKLKWLPSKCIFSLVKLLLCVSAVPVSRELRRPDVDLNDCKQLVGSDIYLLLCYAITSVVQIPHALHVRQKTQCTVSNITQNYSWLGERVQTAAAEPLLDLILLCHTTIIVLPSLPTARWSQGSATRCPIQYLYWVWQRPSMSLTQILFHSWTVNVHLANRDGPHEWAS